MSKKRGVPKTLVAATTLVGTIVGAGILGIPYVVAKAGLFYGFIIIVAVGLALLLLNLFVGEVVLRTKGRHQLPGYAGKYLGKWGKHTLTVTMLIFIYGALSAYLIGEGETLKAIFGGNSLFYALAFFVIAGAIVYKGIKAAGSIELILIGLLVFVVVAIGIFSYDYITLKNFASHNLAHIFLPYGVILFAFAGLPAIPEMHQELKHDKKKLKKAIIIGSVMPIVLYLVFTFIVVGIVGLGDFEILAPNERIATIALSIYSHPVLGILANVLAVLAMFTSFLTLAIALINIYSLDNGLNRKLSFVLVMVPPLVIYLFNFTTFITVLGITGAIAGGIEGIIMVLTYWKAKHLGKRKPEYTLPTHRFLGTVLLVMFILGIVYELYRNFS